MDKMENVHGYSLTVLCMHCACHCHTRAVYFFPLLIRLVVGIIGFILINCLYNSSMQLFGSASGVAHLLLKICKIVVLVWSECSKGYFYHLLGNYAQCLTILSSPAHDFWFPSFAIACRDCSSRVC